MKITTKDNRVKNPDVTFTVELDYTEASLLKNILGVTSQQDRNDLLRRTTVGEVKVDHLDRLGKLYEHLSDAFRSLGLSS